MNKWHVVYSTPRFWLVGLIILVGGSLWVSLRASSFMPEDQAGGSHDFDLYEAIVHRMHQGEGYYQAAGVELRNPRGADQLPYPTRSVFNWRQPTLAWWLSAWPAFFMAHWILLALAFCTLWVWRKVLFNELGPVRGAAQLLILALGLLWAWPTWLPQAVVVHEIWAGVLIALALGCRHRGWMVASWCAALLALSVRELSLPFYLLLGWLEWRERRWHSMIVGGIGLLAWFGFYFWHYEQVQAHLISTDRWQERSWLQWGGWIFVLKTAHMHPLFLGWLPTAPWVVGGLLPLSLFGLFAWSGPLGRAVFLVVAMYVLLFCCIGQSFNYLWGLMYSPLWPLGLWLAPAAIQRCWQEKAMAHAAPA